MASQLDVTGERVTLPVAGQPVAALQAGDPAHPAVLLVPGYTGSKEDFGPILAPVAGAGLFTTAIDLPGQYESPGPAVPAQYTTEALGAVVCATARVVGGGRPVHLLGHSFGGLVARAAALAEPAAFASLVLLSSGPAALGGLRRQRIEALEPVMARHGHAAVYAAVQAAAVAEPDYVAPPPALARFYERRFLTSAPAGLQGMGDAVRAEPDRVTELASTGLPMLVTCGAGDDAWPPEVQRDMAARLGAPFELVPRAAHSAAIENPAGLLEVLLPFWTRLLS